jgi:hypothetical protein
VAYCHAGEWVSQPDAVATSKERLLARLRAETLIRLKRSGYYTDSFGQQTGEDRYYGVQARPREGLPQSIKNDQNLPIIF